MDSKSIRQCSALADALVCFLIMRTDILVATFSASWQSFDSCRGHCSNTAMRVDSSEWFSPALSAIASILEQMCDCRYNHIFGRRQQQHNCSHCVTHGGAHSSAQCFCSRNHPSSSSRPLRHFQSCSCTDQRPHNSTKCKLSQCACQPATCHAHCNTNSCTHCCH